MTATFSSKNLSGPFTKKITVKSNDPKHVQETLSCKGKVLVPITVSPRQAHFRNVDDHATPLPQTITLKRGDGGPLQLKVVDSGKPGITTHLKEVEPGEKYELVVGLAPPMKPGRLRSWVKLETGIKEVPETTVAVYGEIPASWEGLEEL